MDVLAHSTKTPIMEKRTRRERRQDCIPAKLLLRVDDIVEMVGLARRTLFRLISRGIFPRPDKAIGKKIRLWKPETVAAWIEERGEQ
jgi:predicted DNA-binding transcriptional regulator AlpA